MIPVRTAPSLRRRVVANARRLVVAVVGLSLGLLGLALVPLPGPGLVVSVLGLAVLATEFAWAARALHRTTSMANRATAVVNEGRLRRLTLGAAALVALAAGLAVAVGLDGYRAFGVGAVVGAVCTLVMLAPLTGRWLERTLVRLAPPSPSAVDGVVPPSAPLEGSLP